MGHINPYYYILSVMKKFKTMKINNLTDGHGDAYYKVTIQGDPVDLKVGDETYTITDQHFTFYQKLNTQKGPVHFTLTLNDDHNNKIHIYFNESFAITEINSKVIAVDESLQAHLKNMIEPHVNATLCTLQAELQKSYIEKDNAIKTLLKDCDEQSQRTLSDPSSENTKSYIKKLKSTIQAIEGMQDNIDSKYETGTLNILKHLLKFVSATVQDEKYAPASAPVPAEAPASEANDAPTVAVNASNHPVNEDAESNKYTELKLEIEKLESIENKDSAAWKKSYDANIELLYITPDSNMKSLNHSLNKMIEIKKKILKFWLLTFIMKKESNLEDAKRIIDYVNFTPAHLYLAIQNSSNITEFLIAHFKVNINIITIEGLGLLEYAAKSKNNIAVFKWLLDHGANPLTVNTNGELLVKVLPPPYKALLFEKISTKLNVADLSNFLRRFPEFKKIDQAILNGPDGPACAKLIGEIVGNPGNLKTIGTGDMNKTMMLIQRQLLINALAPDLIEYKKNEYAKQGKLFGPNHEEEILKEAFDILNKKLDQSMKI